MSGSETGSEDQGGRPPRGGGGPAGGILYIIVLAGVTKLRLLTHLVHNYNLFEFLQEI